LSIKFGSWGKINKYGGRQTINKDNVFKLTYPFLLLKARVVLLESRRKELKLFLNTEMFTDIILGYFFKTTLKCFIIEKKKTMMNDKLACGAIAGLAFSVPRV